MRETLELEPDLHFFISLPNIALLHMCNAHRRRVESKKKSGTGFDYYSYVLLIDID